MRKLALITAFVLSGEMFAAPQQATQETPTPDQVAQAAANQDDRGAVYGRIKEIARDAKLVIDVDKGKDRSYKFNDPKTTIDIAEDLAVGDRVKVMENKQKNVKTVHVVRDTSGAAGSGNTAGNNAASTENTRSRQSDSQSGTQSQSESQSQTQPQKQPR